MKRRARPPRQRPRGSFLRFESLESRRLMAVLLNELKVNPAGTPDQPYEYIELLGPAGAAENNLYLALINGNAGNTGVASKVWNLSGVTFGTNGLLVIKSPNGGHPAPGATAILADPALDTGGSGLQNGTSTYLLISSATPIVQGTDYDSDDNGTLENLPAGVEIVDSVGFSDGDVGDIVYTTVSLTQSSGTPDAFVRLPGNLTSNSLAAWYCSDLLGDPDSINFDLTRGSATFPVGAILTPGDVNLPVNTPPAVDLNGPAIGIDFTANYPVAGPPVSIVNSTALTVIDAQNPVLLSARVTITNLLDAGQETLSATPTGNISVQFNAATGVLTLNGLDTLARYQQVLRTVTYANSASNPTTTTRSITFTVNDSIADSAVATSLVTLIVVPNQPPVHTLPPTQTTNEDTPLVFSTGNGNALAINDPDAGNAPISLVLTATGGTVTLASSTASISNNGTGQVMALGTVAELNAALQGLVFTPNLNLAGVGAASLQLASNDLGNRGSGGPQTALDTLTINLTPINDPPINTVPSRQTVLVNTPHVFASSRGNTFSVSDVDAGAADVRVTLNVTGGSVTIGTTGITVLGNNSASVVATGPLAALNAALDGMVFTPTLDEEGVGAASIQMNSNDLGNTGLGGALIDTDTVVIDLINSRLEVVGSTLFAEGSEAADVFSVIFVSPTRFVATLNGVSLTLDIPQVNRIEFIGDQGQDRVNFRGTTGAETINLRAGIASIEVIGIGYTASFAQVERVYLHGGGGDDSAFYLNTPPTTDAFYGLPTTSLLVTPSIVWQVLSIPTVEFFVGAGDLAVLYDSPGDDLLTANDASATLSGTGYSITAHSQTETSNVAVLGSSGMNIAQVESGDEAPFTLAPTWFARYGGRPLYAANFSEVVVQASEGNLWGIAYLLDSPGDDQLSMSPVGTELAVNLSGPGYQLSLRGYDQVYAFASTGNDTAHLITPAGGATMYGLPGVVILQTSSGLVQPIGFDEVTIDAAAGSPSTAIFYDTAGHDRLTASPSAATWETPLGIQRGLNFQQVYALSTQGGNDEAYLYDTTGDDTFVATPQLASLTGPNYYAQATGFAIMHGFSTAGGQDTAILIGSTGADTLYVFSTYAALTGTGYYQQANQFTTISVFGMEGIDTVNFYDSPGDDFLDVSAGIATLRSGARLVAVQGFETGRAVSYLGGTDRRRITALDLALQFAGQWINV